jgi:hypothetical protein
MPREFGGCSSRLGSLIGLLAGCGDLLMGDCVLLDFCCRGLLCVEIREILEFGLQDTHFCDHSIDKRFPHRLSYQSLPWWKVRIITAF